MAVCSDEALANRCVEVLGRFQLSALEEWSKDTWRNDFFDQVESSPEEFELLHEETNWCKLLEEACQVCNDWATLPPPSDHEDEEGEESCESTNGLWRVLIDNGINLKSIVALCFWFVEKGRSKTSTVTDKEIGLSASMLYFGLLVVPGSGAFSVFHPTVFQQCVVLGKEILALSTNDRLDASSGSLKRGRPKSSTDNRSNKRKKGVSAARRQYSDDDEDEVDSDDDYNAVRLCKQAVTVLLTKTHTACVYVLRVLNAFSLKRCEQSLKFVINHLSEVTRLETDFLVGGRTFSSVAFKGLRIVCEPIHGDVKVTQFLVLKSLLPNFLMLQHSASSHRNHSNVRDQTTRFVSKLIETYGDDVSEGIMTLVHQICAKTNEKADCRTKMSTVVIGLLKKLPIALFTRSVKWIKKFCLNVKVGYRMFGIEILASLILELDSETLDSELQLTIVEFLFKRCSDKAPSVRAKALITVAHCVTSTSPVLVDIVKRLFVNPGKRSHPDPNDEVEEVVSGESDKENTSNVAAKGSDEPPEEMEVDNSNDGVQESHPLDVNKSILGLVLSRCRDDKVHVRKAALQILEGLLKLVPALMSNTTLSLLKDHCLDPALLIRKQIMQTITSLLEIFPENETLQLKWIEGVLPGLLDRETTVQEKCGEAAEAIILSNVLPYDRSVNHSHKLAWKILNLLSKSDYCNYVQFLIHACTLWAKANKIKPNIVNILETHIGTENTDAAWLLLSLLVTHLKNVKSSSFAIDYWLSSRSNSHNIQTLHRILQLVGVTCKNVPAKKVQLIVDALKEDLLQLTAPLSLTPNMLEAIRTLLPIVCPTSQDAQDEMKKLNNELLKICQKSLSNLVLKHRDMCDSKEDEIIKYVYVLGEVAVIMPPQSYKKLHLLIQSLVAVPVVANTESQPDSEAAGSEPPFIDEATGSQPLFTGSALSANVRSQAFVTLGKLCLRDEKLAKNCVPALARELETSQDAAIRNSIVCVLSDLCIRYTGLIDPHTSTIAACLKDPSPVVAKKTLLSISSLLQEDYLKFRGSLFFHFVSLIVDENEQIRNVAEYVLINTLLKRNPIIFYNHFVECIFHFNSYQMHPRYNKFSQTEREVELFSLKGDGKMQKKRVQLYKFLLENMTDEHRFLLTSKLCQDVLAGFVDEILPLGAETQSLLQDALVVLACDEIKLSSLKTNAQEEFDDGDVAAAVVATAKKTLVTQVVKKNMIENIVPIIIALKHLLEKKKSSLLGTLMMFLKEIMKDYKNEIKDILAADKQLANEIEFDLQRFEQKQEEEKKKQEKLKQQLLRHENRDQTTSLNESPGAVGKRLNSRKLLGNSFRQLPCTPSRAVASEPKKRGHQRTKSCPDALESDYSIRQVSVVLERTNIAELQTLLRTPKAEPKSPPQATTCTTPPNEPTAGSSTPSSRPDAQFLTTPARAISTPAHRVTQEASLMLSPISKAAEISNDIKDQEHPNILVHMTSPEQAKPEVWNLKNLNI